MTSFAELSPDVFRYHICPYLSLPERSRLARTTSRLSYLMADDGAQWLSTFCHFFGLQAELEAGLLQAQPKLDDHGAQPDEREAEFSWKEQIRVLVTQAFDGESKREEGWTRRWVREFTRVLEVRFQLQGMELSPLEMPPDDPAARIPVSERALVDFVYSRFNTLEPRAVREALFEGGDAFRQLASMNYFLSKLSFRGVDLLWVLRGLGCIVKFPRSAQTIDRLLSCVVEKYLVDNPAHPLWNDHDALYVSCYSLLMLTTDMTNDRVKTKMTMEQFVSNLTGVVSAEVARHMYREMLAFPLEMAVRKCTWQGDVFFKRSRVARVYTRLNGPYYGYIARGRMRVLSRDGEPITEVDLRHYLPGEVPPPFTPPDTCSRTSCRTRPGVAIRVPQRSLDAVAVVAPTIHSEMADGADEDDQGRELAVFVADEAAREDLRLALNINANYELLGCYHELMAVQPCVYDL